MNTDKAITNTMTMCGWCMFAVLCLLVFGEKSQDTIKLIEILGSMIVLFSTASLICGVISDRMSK